MKNIKLVRHITALILLCGFGVGLFAQTGQLDAACFSSGTDSIRPTAAFFNYGSGTKMKSLSRRTKLTIGQLVVGLAQGTDSSSYYGFWTSFLVAPLPPLVTASQGDLLDRIQLTWSNNPLGPFPNQGFKIFRDGVFLAAVDSKTRNFNDFNVIAGRPYLYEVRGINIYGEGQPGKALGFQVPNGVVTGYIQTPNGNPVPDAMVSLTPLQGFSARFGFDDGAFHLDTTATGFMPASGENWSLTFWIKTDSAGADAGILQLDQNYLLNIRPLVSSSGQEGIAIDRGGPVLLSAAFPNATKNGWHHVALSFSEGQLRLYFDGALAAQAPSGGPNFSAKKLNLGARAGTGRWRGKLDELRVYHRTLDELSLGEVMMATASSLTENLKLYWKMDEELGTKSFDVLGRQKLYFCGPVFDKDRPNVRTAGVTNEEGFYRIESVSYGTGTTFLAKPSKDFYLHRALEFNRVESDYATLPDFAVPDTATFELWVNNAGPNGDQCLLSKRWPGNDFRILLRENGLNNDVWIYFNGQEHNFGTLGMGYQHLAFTMVPNGTNRTFTGYKNGVGIGSYTFAGVTGDFFANLAEQWYLGARFSGGGQTDHFDGLIDEVAVYDTILPSAVIQDHVNNSRNPQERGLYVYFALDEGSGFRLNNSGSAFLPFGNNSGAEWTPFAPNQMTTPHTFTPGTRQVTLNPSVTSVDQVDFTDRSFVPVSGFVRYKNTDCFAEKVEILVNGQPYSPRIYTDSTGKFTIDLEPGATATLTPVFEDHQFSPSFWEVINVSSPIAGILFTDLTTRKIKVLVAGGECKKSVLTPSTVCLVKVASLDECFVRTERMPYPDGQYDFEDLPPLEALTVSVTEHSNPDVKSYFQVQGGSTVDLTKRDTAINFIYFSPLQIALNSGLDTVPNCNPGLIVLNQDDQVTLNVSIVEQYEQVVDTMTNMVVDDGVCPLDTGSIRFINGFADVTFDTILSGPTLQYKFKVGTPNPSPPYLKTLQIVGTSIAGRTGTLVKQGVVTGIRNKLNTFTTMMPMMPSVILRDPPGDGSSAFIEKTEKVCKTTEVSMEVEAGVSASVDIEIAPTINFVVAPFGLGKVVTVDPDFQANIETEVTYKKVTNNSFQTCVSFNNKISTDDEDLIVGGERGADLYVGEAINLIFGLADKVTFDSCTVAVKPVIQVEPGNFATTFIYSEFNIKNTVIRYLNLLADDPNTPPADTANYRESVRRWEAIVARNATLKEKAKLIRNLSFDAGVVYEYSETADTTISNSDENGVNTDSKIGTTFGIDFDNAGVEVKLNAIVKSSNAWKTENGTEKGLTTGYTLKDNDPGDAFTVDVAMDSVYKTPVFRIRSGQSSCPWEPGTANREGPNLQLDAGSQFVANNVPANKPAFFNLSIGNLSASNEDWTYGISAPVTGNPKGAIIKLNGEPFDETQLVIVPYGKSVPVTVTVEKGPADYDYEGLRVALYSNCEFERNLALALPFDNDPKFFSYVDLDVHFIRPCSEVKINVPEQNYVVINDDPVQPGTLRRITVSGYDLSSPAFKLIRVQYRPGDGDGAWINVTPLDEILKEDLGPTFTQFQWETAGLPDGPYEIRAIAVCDGDVQPGFSDIIRIRIDREPPKLVGTPQPSDGVYQVGDEISFTFNQHVNCDRIFQDTRFPTLVKNNVGLYDATTGELIDIDVTCYENKIILDPNIDNKFFENRVLRAELRNIEDLTGNVASSFEWEFIVDRNELAWLTDSAGATKYVEEPKSFTASIHNRGGYPVPFTIQGAPDWLHIAPNAGTLVANEIRPITFTIDSSLAFGRWRDTVVLHTETGPNPFFMGGDEPLPLGIRVVCRPPYDGFNPDLFENSMTMVLKVNIEGEFSTDPEDMVAAFIDDELRGRAFVQFVPQLNDYRALLFIYGDPSDMLKPLRLEVWDASQCERYGSVLEQFDFQPDDAIGTLTNPQVIHTGGLLLREVPFNYGWNWLSFNLAFPDNSLNAALASVKHPDNDLMKAQTAFSQYLGGWFGTLTNLNNTSMYIYRADVADTLRMQGTAIDPATMPIPIVAGWNWVGYIPNYALPINVALASLPAQPGDIVKGQHTFSEYLNPTFGWVGNLKYMSPPNGYQIKLAQAGTLTYPPPFNPLVENVSQARGETEPAPAHWAVNPAQFEHSSTLIGMIRLNGANATTSDMELGAFVGNEVRGTAQAIYIEPLDAHLFFLTTYANTPGELVRFKLYNDADASVRDLSETLYFAPNQHSGSIQSPVPFELLTTRAEEDFGTTLGFDVQPNPFATETTLRFNLPKAEEVMLTISDAQGREVARRPISAVAGPNVATWNGRSDTGSWLSSGVYTVRLQAAAGSVMRKVVLQRLP